MPDDEESSNIPTPVPATFTGKLNITSYSYSPSVDMKAEASLPPRRLSSRTTRSSSTALSPLSSTPIKKSGRVHDLLTHQASDASPSRSLSSSPSKTSISRSRKRSVPTRYAPPSTYSHLPPLRDVLARNLICVFIGLNPGVQTSTSGHAYAHPSNLFWKLLHSSGCTTRRCRPEEDGDLPRLFALGNTNIVERPTRNGAELKKSEMDEGVRVLEEKVRTYRPEAVCIVGKSIWESVWRVRKGKAISKGEFRYGWQDEKENMGVLGKSGENLEVWRGARVFVATSTSGLAASLGPAEKERIWRELGAWVEERRDARAAEIKLEDTA